MPIRIHAPRNTSTRYAKSSVYNRPVVSEKVCAYLTDFQTEIRWFQNKEIFLLSIYIQGFIYLDLLLMSRKFSQKKKKKKQFDEWTRQLFKDWRVLYSFSARCKYRV